MPIQWHYNRAGKQNGPVSEDQLKQLAASGKLQSSDMIWREGMDQWDQANTVPDLFPAEGQAAPPPLPPAARSGGPGIGSAVIDSMKQVGQKAKDFAQSEQVQDGVAKVKAKWQSLSGRGKAITVGTAAFVILFAGWFMFGGTGQDSRSRPTRRGSEPSSYSSSFQSSEDSEGFRWESLEDQDAAANSQRYQERGPMYSAGGGLGKGRVDDDDTKDFVQKAIDIGCNAGGAAPVRWYRDPNCPDPERWWLSVAGNVSYRDWVDAFGDRKNVRDYWYGSEKEEMWEHEYDGITVVVVGKERHYSTFTPEGPVPDWKTARIGILCVSFDR